MTRIMKVSEFRRRFRQVSVQVQDTECISASTNTVPFSQHHHHQSLKEMGREGSDEVQFSRVPGGVQEPRVHFRLRAHLASTPPTSRIARLTTPPSGSTFSSLPPALSLSEPPSLALILPYNFVLFSGDVLKVGMPTYSFQFKHHI